MWPVGTHSPKCCPSGRRDQPKVLHSEAPLLEVPTGAACSPSLQTSEDKPRVLKKLYTLLLSTPYLWSTMQENTD